MDIGDAAQRAWKQTNNDSWPLHCQSAKHALWHQIGFRRSFFRPTETKHPPCSQCRHVKQPARKAIDFFLILFEILLYIALKLVPPPPCRVSKKKRSSAIKCVLFLFNLTASSQISIQLNTHTRAHTEKQKNIAGPQLEFLFLRGKKSWGTGRPDPNCTVSQDRKKREKWTEEKRLN